MSFLARYYHKGDWYGLKLKADNWGDAKDICKQHSLVLEGEHKFTLCWPFGLILEKIIG